LSIDEVEVSHSGAFKYTLMNYYMIPSYDRDLWENILKRGTGDPYLNARTLIDLFNKYARVSSTDFLSLTRGVQIDLAERWIKESELANKEEPDIVY
jgi:hypothetical protein